MDKTAYLSMLKSINNFVSSMHKQPRRCNRACCTEEKQLVYHFCYLLPFMHTPLPALFFVDHAT